MPYRPKNEPFPLPFEVYPEEWFRRLEAGEIFPERAEAVTEVDLGCGDGSFLNGMARQYPERNFLGVERLLGRVRKVCRDTRKAELTNVRALRLETTYAVEWLLPKMAEFQQENPEITLMLNPTSEVVELKPAGIDVAIRYRDRRRADRDVEPVLVSDMIVIGAPSLVDGRDLRNPESLVDLPWLQELGTNEAAEWFTFHGVVPDRPLTVHHMPGNLIMNAVRRGDGITYTARAFFREDLEAGKVIELYSEPRFGIYYIQTPEEDSRPAVKTFLRWLMSKAETVTA